MPGFGCEIPHGFDCSKEAYRDWLMREVDNVDGPVDLVAHDWGAIPALRVASLEPTLIRTWAVGGAPLDPEYEWHKVAKLWQTPEVGEQVMEKITPETLAPGLSRRRGSGRGRGGGGAPRRRDDEGGAFSRSIARASASARSGSAGLARVSARGLVLWGADDPYAAPVFGSRLAGRTGARLVAFPDCSRLVAARSGRTRWRRELEGSCGRGRQHEAPVIAGVVLAAGLARRMGRQKLLLQLQGKPVVRWAVERIIPHVEDVVVVTGTDDAAIRSGAGGAASPLRRESAPAGRPGTSIAVGVARPEAVDAGRDDRRSATSRESPIAVMRARCSRPSSARQGAVVAPVYRGVQGTPVVFSSRGLRRAARARRRPRRARGGGRASRARRGSSPSISAMPPDVDTPEDYAKLHVQ